MTSRGLSYEDALAQAQALGYAEADPSTDVDGIDTWHKLIVSANIAFGVSLDTSLIPAAGIRRIRKEDVDTFRKHGLVCKLVSSGKFENGTYSAWVQPTLFPQGALEAAVPMNYNLITLYGDISGRQSFYGQGAGRYPTAFNVVQDCADFLEGNGFYCGYGRKVHVCNSERMRFYVSGESDHWLEAHTAENWHQGVVTEPVSVADIHAWLSCHPTAFIAAISEEIV